MSKYEEAKYKIESKDWVISESKEAIIGYYATFKEKVAQFMLSREGLNTDFRVAKAELITATYAFYGAIRKGFNNHINENKKLGITVNDFQNLLLLDASEHDDTFLLKMVDLLEMYHTCYGMGNLSIEERVYDDIVDQLEEENEI